MTTHPTRPPRGALRIYLGMAPGVGKTYAMLAEGRRRKSRGTSVIVACVHTYERRHLVELLEGLEQIPSASGTGADAEMDRAAVLARRPDVALVDELAHRNAPDGRHEERWRDVQDLLDAGITVITTLNIQEVESLTDVVERITGVRPKETVPDQVVQQADQIELVDITPEALRRRIAHGNLYPADSVDAALSNYFRPGNLVALRELALLWLADQVDQQLLDYRAGHRISEPWETRERILVGLDGGPDGATLIRRTARIVARTAGAELLAMHVARSDGLTRADASQLSSQRQLIELLEGSYHQVVGDDVADAVVQFARAENVTQIVLGSTPRSRFKRLFAGESTAAKIADRAGAIDVHLINRVPDLDSGATAALPRLGRGVTPRRRLQGVLAALAVLPTLTLLLVLLRGALDLTSDALLYLVAVVAVALIGGIWVAVSAAVAASLLMNYYLIPPVHTFTIAERNKALALVVFLVIGTAVALVVELAARRTREAARATLEAATLSTLPDSALRSSDSLTVLLERLRVTLDLAAVSLLERTDEPDSSSLWQPAAAVGDEPALAPGAADIELPINERLRLAAVGRPPRAEDARVLAAFGAQAAAVLELRRLSDQAAEADALAAADRLRTALLSAVSHDLRSPLASAKAAVGSLRSQDVALAAVDRAELLATADESLDRLARLVENLLDLSRLQAGALSVFHRPVSIDEVVPGVLADLGTEGRDVSVEIPDDLPDVVADPALLERVLVNLLSNAIRYNPPGRRPHLAAAFRDELVEVHVVDHGPGIALADRERVFAPFQRMGDTDNTTGLGLGLALARGFTEAMGGSLAPEETAGGGLTMVVTLPAVVAERPQPPPLVNRIGA